MLTVIRGLPGVGKSHYARHHSFNGALVLEGDQLWVDPDGHYDYKGPREKCRAYITYMLLAAFVQDVQHVIITTTSGHASSIQQYVDVAKRYGHETRVLWLDHMNGGCPNNHGVPKEVIDEMKKNWELYPGETYARRVLNGESDGAAYRIKIVDTPPPWYQELHKETTHG